MFSDVQEKLQSVFKNAFDALAAGARSLHTLKADPDTSNLPHWLLGDVYSGRMMGAVNQAFTRLNGVAGIPTTITHTKNDKSNHYNIVVFCNLDHIVRKEADYYWDLFNKVYVDMPDEMYNECQVEGDEARAFGLQHAWNEEKPRLSTMMFCPTYLAKVKAVSGAASLPSFSDIDIYSGRMAADFAQRHPRGVWAA